MFKKILFFYFIFFSVTDIGIMKSYSHKIQLSDNEEYRKKIINIRNKEKELAIFEKNFHVSSERDEIIRSIFLEFQLSQHIDIVLGKKNQQLFLNKNLENILHNTLKVLLSKNLILRLNYINTHYNFFMEDFNKQISMQREKTKKELTEFKNQKKKEKNEMITENRLKMQKKMTEHLKSEKEEIRVKFNAIITKKDRIQFKKLEEKITKETDKLIIDFFINFESEKNKQLQKLKEITQSEKQKIKILNNEKENIEGNLFLKEKKNNKKYDQKIAKIEQKIIKIKENFINNINIKKEEMKKNFVEILDSKKKQLNENYDRERVARLKKYSAKHNKLLEEKKVFLLNLYNEESKQISQKITNQSKEEIKEFSQKLREKHLQLTEKIKFDYYVLFNRILILLNNNIFIKIKIITIIK